MFFPEVQKVIRFCSIASLAPENPQFAKALPLLSLPKVLHDARPSQQPPGNPHRGQALQMRVRKLPEGVCEISEIRRAFQDPYRREALHLRRLRQGIS